MLMKMTPNGEFPSEKIKESEWVSDAGDPRLISWRNRNRLTPGEIESLRQDAKRSMELMLKLLEK